MKIARDINIPNFHVCMRDDVSSLKSLKSVHAVVNLHTSDEIGIHWSCFIPSYFFDSCGLPPTNKVKEVMKHGEYNTFQIQTPGTKLCGQLCIFVLYQLKNNKPFLDILLGLRENFKST